MNLRIANKADIPTLVQFNCAMALETENKVLPEGTVLGGVTAVMEDPSKGFYLVVEDEGMVVATLLITIEWSDWRNAPMWWFQSVYVQKSHRGKGIFSLMYHYIRDLATKEGAGELRLYVDKDNTHAQKVYEKLGRQLPTTSSGCQG